MSTADADLRHFGLKDNSLLKKSVSDWSVAQEEKINTLRH
jgi:hypothetical protein